MMQKTPGATRSVQTIEILRRRWAFCLTAILLAVHGMALCARCGLVASYRFDRNLSDSSRWANDSTASSEPTFVTGHDGWAIAFDGTEFALQTPIQIDQSTDSGGFTMCAWVRPQESDDYRNQIVSSDNGGFDWSMLVQDNEYRVFTGNQSWFTGYTIEAGDWQFVAAIFDPQQGVTFILNDTYMQTASIGFDDSCSFVGIGYNPGYGEYLEGDVDDVLLFNSVLSLEELTAWVPEFSSFQEYLLLPTTDIGPGRFPITNGEDTLYQRYFSNISLSETNDEITHVLISQHGSGTPIAGSYMNRGVGAAQRVPGMEARTCVIALQLATATDFGYLLEPNDLYYTGTRFWGGLSGSTSDNPRPFQVSSYEVLNTILETIAISGVFPNLTDIIVAGHSAGGQFTQRYAVFNDFEDEVAVPAGLRMRYVVMNPSSYVYLTNERRVDRESRRSINGYVFGVPDASDCSNYNAYGYGLDNFYSHLSNIDAEMLRDRYQGREVHYLVGELDNDPNSSSLAKGCAAMLQGETRLDRSLTMYYYVQHVYGPSILERQFQAIVPGAGHNGRVMMQSDEGLWAIFDYEDK